MTTSEPREFVSGRCPSMDEKMSLETSPTQPASSDRPTSASSITTKASFESYKPKPQLSTLQLLVIHIGFAACLCFHFYPHHWRPPLPSAALTLFLATTDAVSTATSFSSTCSSDNITCRQLFRRVYRRFRASWRLPPISIHGSGSHTCSRRRPFNLCMEEFRI